MPNMGYCRFRNTEGDLREVVENWDDEEMSRDEVRARERIYMLAQQIVEMGLPESNESEERDDE